MNISPTPEFKAWATSFSGCDGGDLKAPIWFCGIEDGGREPPPFLEVKALKGISYGDDSKISKTHYENFFGDSRYDMNAIKLHAAIFGEFSEDGKFLIGEKHISSPEGCYTYANEHKAYSRHVVHSRSVFKLNLYPLPFPNTEKTHWTQLGYTQTTGFPDKDAYRDWCAWKRFEMICKWRKETTIQKILICTGTEHLSEYLLAFGWDQTVETFTNRVYALKASLNRPTENSKVECYHLKIDGALLIVIPFLGIHRLYSHKDIVAVGKWIRNLLISQSYFDETSNTFK